jgi:hypothetical protein
MQTLGPHFAKALRETPHDPEGAYQRAMRAAEISGAFAGLGWALFPARFFQGPVRQVLFQAFGVQPSVAVAQRATENAVEDRPITEGLGETYVDAAVTTAAFSALSGSPRTGTPPGNPPPGGVAPPALAPQKPPSPPAPARPPGFPALEDYASNKAGAIEETPPQTQVPQGTEAPPEAIEPPPEAPQSQAPDMRADPSETRAEPVPEICTGR